MTYFLLNLRFQISFTSTYCLLKVNKITINEKFAWAVRYHILLPQKKFSRLSDSRSYYNKRNSRRYQTTHLTMPRDIVATFRQNILLHQENVQNGQKTNHIVHGGKLPQLSDDRSYWTREIVGAVRKHILLHQEKLSQLWDNT